uniref:Fe2OG dioxygenase domain-containing protein n=1 Tax=Chromera velia CCMP2878 TaxID=1169474 RepID=A0A0G4FBL9_9ALVE|eukprot:Cvel_16173.t1-p1 / transcript=Cvel_16173.t1 / gene=Cvel_16173 / organism=Chromera_velia_CCMP2878 / gene_product=Protein NLRC3, putative / transcript_product=Protein NLRC3, putative / location=Cvel_scaffold1233:13745-39088(-) / protein_length=2251 / sequence_SO=supercontig / SO=protein_coding / is_pseudo=false
MSGTTKEPSLPAWLKDTGHGDDSALVEFQPKQPDTGNGNAGAPAPPALLEEGDGIGAGDSLLRKGFLSKEEADKAMQDIEKEVDFQQWYHMPGKKTGTHGALDRLRRVKAAMAVKTEDELLPWYRFPVNDQQRHGVTSPMAPAVEALRQKVSKELGVKFNHAVVLLYRDGDDCIGFHKDKTLDLDSETPIVSLSLGMPRPYTLRPDIFKREEEQTLLLGHGSLLALGPRTNENFYHSIRQLPPQPTAADDPTATATTSTATGTPVGPRISVTFRAVTTFKDGEGRLVGKGASFQSLNWPLELKGAHKEGPEEPSDHGRGEDSDARDGIYAVRGYAVVRPLEPAFEEGAKRLHTQPPSGTFSSLQASMPLSLTELEEKACAVKITLPSSEQADMRISSSVSPKQTLSFWFGGFQGGGFQWLGPLWWRSVRLDHLVQEYGVRGGEVEGKERDAAGWADRLIRRQFGDLLRALHRFVSLNGNNLRQLTKRAEGAGGSNGSLEAAEAEGAEVASQLSDLLRKEGLGPLSQWPFTFHGRIALLLLCDQMNRNAFRGEKEMFALDPLGLLIAKLEARLLILRSVLLPMMGGETGTASPHALADLGVEPLAAFWPHLTFVSVALSHSEELVDCERSLQVIKETEKIVERTYTSRGTEGESEPQPQTRAPELPAAPPGKVIASLQRTARSHKDHLHVLSKFKRYPHRNDILGRETTEAERLWLEGKEGGKRLPLWARSTEKKDKGEAAEGSAEGVSPSPSPGLLPARRLKLLVLHSNRQTVERFKSATQPFLQRVLGPVASLTYADAPHPYVPRGEAEEAVRSAGLISGGPAGMAGGSGKCWWNATDDPASMRYEGLEASLEYINRVFMSEGPFDGVIGFSQGGCLAGLLAALQPYKHVSFKFIAIISGFYCRDRDHVSRFIESGEGSTNLEEVRPRKAAFSIPSFHVWGQKDQLVLPRRSEILASTFKDPVIHVHPSDHFVKAIKHWPIRELKDWMLKVSGGQGSGAVISQELSLTSPVSVSAVHAAETAGQGAELSLGKYCRLLKRLATETQATPWGASCIFPFALQRPSLFSHPVVKDLDRILRSGSTLDALPGSEPIPSSRVRELVRDVLQKDREEGGDSHRGLMDLFALAVCLAPGGQGRGREAFAAEKARARRHIRKAEREAYEATDGVFSSQLLFSVFLEAPSEFLSVGMKEKETEAQRGNTRRFPVEDTDRDRALLDSPDFFLTSPEDSSLLLLAEEAGWEALKRLDLLACTGSAVRPPFNTGEGTEPPPRSSRENFLCSILHRLLCETFSLQLAADFLALQPVLTAAAGGDGPGKRAAVFAFSPSGAEAAAPRGKTAGGRLTRGNDLCSVMTFQLLNPRVSVLPSEQEKKTATENQKEEEEWRTCPSTLTAFQFEKILTTGCNKGVCERFYRRVLSGLVDWVKGTSADALRRLFAEEKKAGGGGVQEGEGGQNVFGNRQLDSDAQWERLKAMPVSKLITDPIPEPVEFATAEEMAPLWSYLSGKDISASAPAGSDGTAGADDPGVRHFPKGAVTSDGRLDLCKQAIAAEGVDGLLAALGADALRGPPAPPQNDAGAPSPDELHFVKGAVTSDGRLDLCKQAIGPGGVDSLLSALGSDAVRGDRQAPNGDLHFSKGALTSDGRLDLCKQAIGPSGLDGLLSALGSDAVRGGAEKETEKHFAKGAITTDGRLDLCKQAIGPTGVTDMLDALAAAGRGEGEASSSASSSGEQPGGGPRVRHLLLGNNVCGNGLGQKVAAFVRSGKSQIVSWYIAGNAMDVHGIRPLCEALEGDTLVRQLWLKRNPLKAPGAEAIASMLCKNSTLQILDLSYTGLLDEGVRKLARGLIDAARGGQSALTHLLLDGNGITPEGARAVAEVLETPDLPLVGLSLGVNRLGNEGAKCIAEALKRTPKSRLHRLSFPSCRIETEGADALARLLSMPSCGIRFLDLGFAKSTPALGELPNRIQNGGAEALASALRTNRSLRGLDVVYNQIQQTGIAAFHQALVSKDAESNRTLLFLPLEQFGVPHNELHREEIRLALRRNAALMGKEEVEKALHPAHLREILSLVKVHEKQIVAYRTDLWVRYPAFDRFATGDMLYDWDILDVNHERLQHAPGLERRKAATTFPVDVEQFQKGKGKGNGGAVNSAGRGAAPAGPGGRTNLKPKEAAADANAEKAGGKLPPPEKVITPGIAEMVYKEFTRSLQADYSNLLAGVVAKNLVEKVNQQMDASLTTTWSTMSSHVTSSRKRTPS